MTSDRIINRINQWDPITATNVPSTGLTAEGLRESLREFARQFDPDRRIAARLEAGELVRQHLASITTKAPPRPAWMPQPTVPALPIVHNNNLQPDEWRLLDTDGGVMSEGRIDHLNNT
ncbi:hypothetical protein AB0J14_04625 [Micromonospora arborensis]|uniref:hypothetical protein n=1 Tax=Micromonospora arborensis TaxID=2116518 RepID=UPI0034044118